MSRLWQPRETRLLSEWVAKNYPEDKVMFRVRLGRPPAWAEASIAEGAPPEIYKIYQRWADAIIIREKELILIEAKIRPIPGVVSEINLYAQLIPKTPELAEFMDRPIRKLILMAVWDPEITELASVDNIKVEIYNPSWVIEYLKEHRKYKGKH